MGYYTNYEINITENAEATANNNAEMVQRITELSQKGDEASLNEVQTLLENRGKSLTQKICDALNEITEYDFDLTGDTSIRSDMGEIKWYDSIKDLLEVSKKFPETLIQVDGEGEESGDIWRSFYLGGKVQKAEVKVVYEDFDESKLV